ncbi:hypothetical protein [Haloferula sargassicola]
MPSDLHADLQARFARPAVTRPAVAANTSWLSRLGAAISMPGLAISAAAILLLGVIAPRFVHQGDESFRGTNSAQVEAVPVILAGGPSDILDRLSAAGDLEPGSLKAVASAAEAARLAGPKVTVDFSSGIIQSVDADGRVVFHTKISADSPELSLTIAEAVSHL